MLLKLAYLTLCRTVQLLALRGRGAAKDLDILGDGRIMLRSGRN